MNIPMVLADGTATITSADFESVLTAIQSQISVSTIVGVIAVAVGASVGFVFMHWGINKLKAQIMKSARKGKL